MSCWLDKSFHSILIVREPDRLPSKGIDDTVSRAPVFIGQPDGTTEHRYRVIAIPIAIMDTSDKTAAKPNWSYQSLIGCPKTWGMNLTRKIRKVSTKSIAGRINHQSSVAL